MNARELRIGNLLSYYNDTVIVTPEHIQIIERGKESYKPIPLTEEWLLKFGFDERDYTYSFGGFHIAKDFTFWQWLTTDESNGINLNNCPRFVHRLQNLYYALTGKELIIKESVPS